MPRLNRPWVVESYFAQAAQLGIEAALHMEVDVAEPDIIPETAFMLGIHPRVVGAIANCRPERPEFPAELDALAMLGGVRGLRRLLQFQPPELSEAPLFRDNLKRLPAYGFTFDICVKSHELDYAVKLVPACPGVQFVLDHCGNPRIADKEWDPWAGRIAEIARNPNVVCKVSGVLANVTEDWTVDEVRPYIEHVIGCFGWDRVVWGSDHPVVTLFADLPSWLGATRQIIAGATEEEKAKLLHRNAERIYRVDPAA